MILDIWIQASTLETEAETALENPEHMLEVPSGLQDSPLPTYYHFQNIHTAETMCHLWKLTMVLVQFMKACRWRNKLTHTPTTHRRSYCHENLPHGRVRCKLLW